jgi:hypothetical protein
MRLSPSLLQIMAIVPKTIIDLARKEIVALGPEGRQIDMIGTLRAAQAAIVGISPCSVVGQHFFRERSEGESNSIG